VNSIKESLGEVEHALDKFDAGNYGLCEGCGQPIVPDRLEAMPTARVCMNCASRR
jgi:DnaK suppressor protein